MTCSPCSGADCSSLPSSSTILAEIPGRGRIADPGLHVVTPGSGEIITAPVSVCHHVSTMGVVSAPNTSRYQRHASGLIGSPTEPNKRRLERSWAKGISRPHFMNVRTRVGAV